MSAARDRIVAYRITPIAIPDPPLLNAAGAHEPYALRCFVELESASGIVGVGEAHGSQRLLTRLRRAAETLLGLEWSSITTAQERAQAELDAEAGGPPVDRVFAPLEVAMLDGLGRRLGAPVHDLLGGRHRDRVEFAGYLFYKWDRHLAPDSMADAWGEITTTEQLVASARQLQQHHGFRSWKLKGGVHPIGHEIDTVRALVQEFPGEAVRIDPNCRWTVDAALEVVRETADVLQYLEDPVLGLTAMAQVTAASPVPIATNMLIGDFADHLDLLRDRVTDVVLVDHHVAGGLRRAAGMAELMSTAGLGVAMHSNSHLGISLAAMAHLAAAAPGLSTTCDTHYPWNLDHDVVRGGPLTFTDGFFDVPTSPGLGVELDPVLLAEAHDRYLGSTIRERRDGDYARQADPFLQRRAGDVALQLVTYVYPWDVGARLDAVLAELAPQRVAVAATYHSVRAACFRHDRPEVVDAWHAASYVAASPGSFSGAAPLPPSGWCAADAFSTARRRLEAQGHTVDAWVVVLHNSELGRRHPELAAVNAFGDVLPGTLCAANPLVQAYGRELVRSVVRDGGAQGVVLEAVAPLGQPHPAAHDKAAALGWGGELRPWASACFCSRCEPRLTPELRTLAVGVLSGVVPTDSAEAVDGRRQLLADRVATTAASLAELVTTAQLAGADRVAVFVDHDAAAFGPGAPLDALSPGWVDTTVAGFWRGDDVDAARLRAVVDRGASEAVGAYLTVLDGHDQFVTALAGARDLGATEIHLYHAGLASRSTLKAAAAAIGGTVPSTERARP